MKYYYKITDFKNRSCIVNADKRLIVNYLPNKWVYPRVEGSKLMVFKNENKAKIWKSTSISYFNYKI